MAEFNPEDHWKAIILFGRNTATYKIALAKSLLAFCHQGMTTVSWEYLSKQFFHEYLNRLNLESPMPQLYQPGRLAVMVRIIAEYKSGKLDEQGAIDRVGNEAFGDVIKRFHNVGSHGNLSESMFYRFDMGKNLIITDDLHSLIENSATELESELEARWSLLEGAFSLHHDNYQLCNDLREIYLKSEDATERKSLTGNVGFLQGYQGNTCFYCGLDLNGINAHVDHVLPRQVVQHDLIWNLVLAHAHCNEQKSDRLVGDHYIEKLIARNENIMGSNHPWKKEIEHALGSNAGRRRSSIKEHYQRVGQILGWNHWGGSPTYSPDKDAFYKKLVTLLNQS
jgi:hypothetical protein